MRPVGRLAVGALFAVAALTVGDLSAGEKGKGKVKVGDPAPAFQAVDAQGKPWKSADHVGKNVVVLWFYPAALTGG